MNNPAPTPLPPSDAAKITALEGKLAEALAKLSAAEETGTAVAGKLAALERTYREAEMRLAAAKKAAIRPGWIE